MNLILHISGDFIFEIDLNTKELVDSNMSISYENHVDYLREEIPLPDWMEPYSIIIKPQHINIVKGIKNGDFLDVISFLNEEDAERFINKQETIKNEEVCYIYEDIIYDSMWIERVYLR